MIQPHSPILHLPLLLATDGSPTAQMAQQLLIPIAQHLVQTASAAPVAGETTPTGLVALHVESKPSGWRLRRRQAEATPSSSAAASQTESVEAPEEAPEEQENPAIASTPSSSISSSTSSSSTANQAAAPPLPDLPPSLALLQTELEQEPLKSLPAQLHTVQGRPATEILKHANQFQVGLIGLGCHGTSSLREMTVGSVSAEIARYASSHVLIARQPAEENASPRWHHVMLVVTGDSATQSAIALTRQLIPVGVRQLTILCIQPPITSHYLFGPFAAPTPSWQLTQSLQAAQREQSENMVHQAERAFAGLNVSIETIVQTGEAGPLICQVAQRQHVDVIALGSDASPRRSPASSAKPKGRRLPLRSLRLTATADYVIHHAVCPVLLCRLSSSMSQGGAESSTATSQAASAIH